MSTPFRLQLQGQSLTARELPSALSLGSRGAPDADPFLGGGAVVVRQVVDLSPASRAAAGSNPIPVDIPGERTVIALETGSGETLFMHPENLRTAAARRGALSDGVLPLDDLVPAGGSGRGAAQFLWRRVSILEVGDDSLLDAAKAKAVELARDWLGRKIGKALIEGPSWIGARALAWAVESRLLKEPGLYRWVGAAHAPSDLQPITPPDLAREAGEGPLLLFLHGTGSNTSGSYADLRSAATEWSALERTFGHRIYAYEHHTLSASPVENALELVRALPNGAKLRIVSHSRGGLVGDLLCLDPLSDDEIAAWTRVPAPGVDASEIEAVTGRERALLRDLRTALITKKLVVERYVRVACPARGTLLASANFDVFLSALLSVLGTVTGLRTSGIYSGIARLVLEISKRRMDPQVIPGIEAMLPDSPLAALLGRASRIPGLQFAVIAGDVEGGSLWQRLGVLLTDWALFDRMNNDLVVDTDSMYEGLLRDGGGHGLFDQGARVNHFRYFQNPRTVRALAGWMTPATPEVTDFERVPGRGELGEGEEKRRGSRSTGPTVPDGTKPVVIFLPGIMGSHLKVHRPGDKPGGGERVWFSVPGIALGRFPELRWAPGPDGHPVEPEAVFEMFYGDLCDHLEATHHVIRFPYDWRQPIQTEARRLGELVKKILTTLKGRQPVRLLAHSMGGLVCRTLIEDQPGLWKQIVNHPGGRFVMLGTPNNGSHLLVQHLIGKAGTTRSIARLDQRHGLQEILDVVASLPGALQLLPRPGFVDTAGEQTDDYFQAEVWQDFRSRVRDRWFGNGITGVPAANALQEATTFWSTALPGNNAPEPTDRVAYVFGQADETACGVRLSRGGSGPGEIQILTTPLGDGSVSWKSGRLGNLPEERHWWIPASHGDLARTPAAFAGLLELLETGTTNDSAAGRGLNRGFPPGSRGAIPKAAPFEPGPPIVPNETDLAAGLLGQIRTRAVRRPATRGSLEISVTAGDLRFSRSPILCGHYPGDPIAGTEDIIDRQVVQGGLRQRERLGFYPTDIGTSTVVLLPDSREPGGRIDRQGALVVGLGEYGSLASSKLVDTVRLGVLRLLLTLRDRQAGNASTETAADSVRLTSLMLGYNSTTSIGIEDSLASVVTGVVAAGRQFSEAFPDSRLQIASVEFIELYLDTAITAARSLLRLAERLAAELKSYEITLKPADSVRIGPGALPRLADSGRGPSYWSRLIVTGDDRDESREAPRNALEPRLAERLRYRILSQRARAETIVQHRQPQLLEGIVRDTIRSTHFDRSLSDFLFQLLVPIDLKEMARNTERLLLVVDGATANFPWEMMTSGGVPLVARTRVVRQLESTQFRRQVKQATTQSALVVGNPSTAGFGKVFPKLVGDPESGLPSLTGAEREAETVAGILSAEGYEVAHVIPGADTRTILSALFSRPHRILHIAAHGLFGLTGDDGQLRSGVVLSDGILLTAAEVEQLEIVPEVVFLNCCHLGKTDVLPRDSGKLAYSLSRELIEMGVRCVIAAGWEVDDAAADLFARTFYTELIIGGQGFGDAVFTARRRIWEELGQCNTWGAYQAYGDPTFRLDREPPDRPARTAQIWVSPLEVEAELGQWITRANQRGPQPRPTAADLAVLLREVPPAFKARPEIQSALGRFHAALGDFAAARQAYAAAMAGPDPEGRLTIQTLEQLANVEARLGEKTGNLVLLNRAIHRLEGLLGIGAGQGPVSALHGTPERLSIYASALKRKAAVLLRTNGNRTALRQSLAEASRVYAAAMKRAGEPGVNPYPAINHLQLAALLGKAGPGEVALAETAADAARDAFRHDASFFNAVMPVDALLLRFWIEGRLPAEADLLIRYYRDAGNLLPSTVREWDSVTRQLELLAEFGERLGVAPPIPAALQKIGAGLRSILRTMPAPPTATTQGVRASRPTPRRNKLTQPPRPPHIQPPAKKPMGHPNKKS